MHETYCTRKQNNHKRNTEIKETLWIVKVAADTLLTIYAKFAKTYAAHLHMH